MVVKGLTNCHLAAMILLHVRARVITIIVFVVDQKKNFEHY